MNTQPNTYASYQTEIYLSRETSMRAPKLSTNIESLQAEAERLIPPQQMWYAKSTAGLGRTAANNRAAFDKWVIVPRMLRDATTAPSLRRTIFGDALPVPVVMAPVGVQSLYHPEGEKITAKVFAEFGLPYTISTASSFGFKDVADAYDAAKGNGGGAKWYQLYWPADDELTKSLLKTAKANGYKVLVVTLDTWAFAWRPGDLDSGFTPFIHNVGTAVIDQDAYAHSKLGFDSSAATASFDQRAQAARYFLGSVMAGRSPTWDRLKLLREAWGDDPIVLKGIQSPKDAKLAAEYGVDGIIVSNHAGRQVDGAIGSLDALPAIVDAVKGSNLTIGFDSGIRSGADIFKALALGADFVQLGQPVMWGLALDGADGTRHVLKTLLADFELHVGLAGCPGIDDVTREMLVRADSL